MEIRNLQKTYSSDQEVRDTADGKNIDEVMRKKIIDLEKALKQLQLNNSPENEAR